MMQLLTNDFLASTPHKVGLNTRERYAFAYFHEPNFSSVIQTLPEYGSSDHKPIHYGTHFTNMCMRNYPERIAAKRVRAENRMAILESPSIKSLPNSRPIRYDSLPTEPKTFGTLVPSSR